jgi:hypothetical protein
MGIKHIAYLLHDTLQKTGWLKPAATDKNAED